MASKNRIEISKAKNRQFFLTFKSANNQKVMTSGETYKSKQSVEKALKSIKKIIKNPVVVDKTKAIIKK